MRYGPTEAAWRQRLGPAFRRIGQIARLEGPGQRFEAGPMALRRVGTLLRPRRVEGISHGRIHAGVSPRTVSRKSMGCGRGRSGNGQGSGRADGLADSRS